MRTRPPARAWVAKDPRWIRATAYREALEMGYSQADAREHAERVKRYHDRRKP